MKLAVFGGTGRTGRPVIEQALAAGHEVTALVRDPAKLSITHERLKVFKGDVMNAQDVEQAVAGQDAVITVIGRTKESPSTLMTTATENIIAAMKKHNVGRIISLTGAGVPDPHDQPKFIDNLIRALFKLPIGGMKEMLQDSIAHTERIKASGLDWVIVRGPRLTEEPRKGQYRVGYVGKDSGIKVGRADLAEFILKQLTANEYKHKMPVISY
jgi:putative NADH-flavin reductase